jgi:hypothetical protein
MEPIERSKTSASNTQTPGNYPKETVLHLQHGKNSNLKSKTVHRLEDFLKDQNYNILTKATKQNMTRLKKRSAIAEVMTKGFNSK